MAPVPLTRPPRAGALALWLGLVGAGVGTAAAPRVAPAAPAPTAAASAALRDAAPRSLDVDGQAAQVASDVDAPPGKRSYLQSAYTKVRAGAYLKMDVPAAAPPQELRGVLARRRDAQVARHYARLAELDVLADEASRSRDVRLAEQVETARRRDTQQHFLIMQALKVQTLAAWAAAGP